jgi:Rrf2 family protein
MVSAMLYSRSAQYAIRALALMANESWDACVSIQEIARSARVPLPFLAKIMQTLAKCGIVVSQKGPGGGVALARPPQAVTLEEIVIAIDGDGIMRGCVLGLARCSDRNPCPVHEVWKDVGVTLQRRLHDRTLADIAPGKIPMRRRRKA